MMRDLKIYINGSFGPVLVTLVTDCCVVGLGSIPVTTYHADIPVDKYELMTSFNE